MENITIVGYEKRYKELLLKYSKDNEFSEFLNLIGLMYKIQSLQAQISKGYNYNSEYDMLLFQIAAIQQQIQDGEI